VQLDDVVPADKYDVAAVGRASDVGWPDIEPVLPQLLTWIQDMNWPVAPAMCNLLVSIGEPLIPNLRPILNSDDAEWKYWLITGVLRDWPADLVEQLRPELSRISDRPTPDERASEVDVEARAVLG
jgi:Domain of unknown function (DUF5071)